MSDNYQDVVLAYYNSKKEEGKLPLILQKPTTAKLKEHCLMIYDSRYHPDDNDILITFFKVDKIEENFRKTIVKKDTGYFRPLLNHLKDDTVKTDEKNTELLAWLIDFQPRPSIRYYKALNAGPEDEPVGVVATNSDEGVEEEKTEISTQDTTKVYTGPAKGRRKLLIVLCIIIAICLATDIMWKNYTAATKTASNCMYWDVDHYERINCNETVKGSVVETLNVKKLISFKKIMQPDTLTKNSLGKVWYSGKGEMRDFFTSSGMHPIDTVKRLKPLTNYIITRYVSYHRYLLKRLIWAITLIASTYLIVIGISKFKRRF